MRDINFTLRDSLGNVSFNITNDSITGMELLIQKVTIAVLSNSFNTSYQNIVGANLKSIGIVNINPVDLTDLKNLLSTNIASIEKKFKEIDVSRTAPLTEKLDTLSLLDVTLNIKTLTVIVSLYIKNLAGQSTSIDIPVRNS